MAAHPFAYIKRIFDGYGRQIGSALRVMIAGSSQVI
jgi:hypothetical protein